MTSEPRCERCGAVLPPEITTPYCCVGCALLAKIPRDAEGNFPVNRELVSILVLGVLYFNQLLLWAGETWALRQERIGPATRMAWIGFGLAVLVWLAQARLLVSAQALQRRGLLVALLTLAVLLSTLRESPPSGGMLAAVNAIFLFWNFRGALRRRR